MNRTHRNVWSERLGAYVVVSELTRSRGKAATTTLSVVAAAAALFASGTAFGQAVLPSGGRVTAGQASIGTQGTAMTVTQGTQRAVINWQDFSIGQNASVQFVQPNASAVVLNRVVGNEGSVIDGALHANGQVFIINPNGVLFGTHARVDVGALAASTRGISDVDFLAGKTTLSGSGAGQVVNHGRIDAADGGYVALIGRNVRNDGVITARLGSVAAAAGDKVSLNFNGDSLVGVTIDQGTLAALIDNGGAIRADGGQILLSAKTASALVDAVVNNTGELRAQTIEHRDGRVLLLADMDHGQTRVAGTLDASAPTTGNGGFIETSAARVAVADGALITTASAAGQTGRWLLDPTNFTVAAGSGAATSSSIGASTLQTALASSNVTLQTLSTGNEAGDINVNAPFAWSANNLTLNAHGSIYVNATMDGSGTAQLTALYGQGALAAGNTARFVVASGAKVNLPDGPNLILAQGSDSAPQVYHVLSSLGTATSTSASTLQGLDVGPNSSGFYALGADIDASATAGWNAGSGFQPIGHSGGFVGGFEGLGHTITGLTINRPSDTEVGLFSSTPEGGRYANLRLVNATITGSDRTAALIGNAAFAEVDNVTASGSVTGGSQTGGLLGVADGARLVYSTASTAVHGGNEVGGLVGHFGGVLDHVSASGTVSGASYVGGLAGSAGGISQSQASGNVTASGGYAGGLVGVATTVSSSSASGVVHAGGDFAGGLAGQANSLDTSQASGSVTSTANYVGGAAGKVVLSAATVQASGNVAGGDYVGGAFGNVEVNLAGSTASGTVSGANRVGGLAGRVGGTVSASHATGVVTATGSSVGGLVGSVGTITGSDATGAVNAVSGGYVGGLAGDAYAITGSTASGQVHAGGAFAGGVVGQVNYIDTSQASGSVTSTASFVGGVAGKVVVSATTLQGSGNVVGVEYVGGVVGTTEYGLSSSTASGAVSGVNYVGGLAGHVSGTLSASNAIGAVTASGNNAGGLVGSATAITGSYASGNVTAVGDYAGGLVGNVLNLDTSHASGAVTSTGSYVGGLAGGADNVTASQASGNVSGVWFVGGVVGYARNAADGLAATGTVTGSGNYVGGAAGNVDGNLSNSTATRAVSGVNYVGGLAGAVGGTLSASHATGAVTATGGYVGGLVGGANAITNSSASGMVHAGGNLVGGLVGQVVYIDNSQASGAVTSTASYVGGVAGKVVVSATTLQGSGNVVGVDYVGGVVGTTEYGLSSSTASGAVSGVNYVGGLAGHVSGTLSASNAIGAVTASGSNGGGLVGSATAITSSYATGAVTVSGDYAGGLVGNVLNLDTSHASGAVTSTGSYVGGLAGGADNVTASQASGNVSGVSFVGGVVGYARISADGLSATGTVTGTGDLVGGAAGSVDGNLSNSTATRAVSGVNYVGGLAGTVGGTLSASHATGAVTATGSNAGGLVGGGNAISGSYASGAVVAGGDYAGGLVGQVIDINTSQASGSVTSTASYVGGVAGRVISSATTLQGTGNVVGVDYVGGAVGKTEYGLSSSTASGMVSGAHYVGGLAGNVADTLSASHAIGAVTASGGYAGGLVGTATAVTGSYANGAVTAGGDAAGGLAGEAVNVATSSATGAVTGAGYVGGLVGNGTGTISMSQASGNVTGSASYVGGLVGRLSGSITNSQASGSVGAVGGSGFGGLVGWLQAGSIADSSASGAVSVSSDSYSVGGFVGFQRLNTAISGSHSTGNVSATNVNGVAGLVGEARGSVTNSWSSGNVSATGQNVGGLIGTATRNINLANSYYDLGAVVVTVEGVNQSAQVTLGGIYSSQYAAWVAGARAPLSPASYFTADGNGAWQIGSTADLKNLLGFTAAGSLSFKLTQNIDLSALPGWHLPLMAGNLDGNYHVLGNLQNLQVWNDNQGLVGLMTGGIQRLGVTGVVQGGSSVGGLVGELDGTVNESYAQVAVAGNSDVGGLVGYNGNGSIIDAYASGSVTVTAGPYLYGLGALVGENDNTITRSYASATVSCTITGCDAYGGLVGLHYGSETGSFAVVDRTGPTVIDPSVWGTNAPGESLISAVQARQASTFTAANWNLSTAPGSSATWRSYDGLAAPLLRGFLQPLTVTAVGGLSRAYDGTTGFGSTVSYSTQPDTSRLLGALVISMSSANVGTRTITPSGLYSSQDGYDIAYANGTGSVTPKVLTAPSSQITSRAYNGSTAATAVPGALAGLVGNETLGLSSVATLDSANAGNRTAQVVYALADGSNGGLASNYVLPSQAVAALVTPKLLTIAASSASGKVYDGTTVAQVTPGTLQGLLGNDTLGVTGTGLYDSKNAGQRSVTAHYALSDGNTGLASNYLVPDTTGLVATITPRVLNLAFDVATRSYDGTTAATAATSDNRVSGDQLQFSYGATFADAHAGQGKSVAISSFALAGADAGNYTTVLAPASGSITPRQLSIAGTAAVTRAYDGTTAVSVTAGTLSGLVGNESLAFTPQAVLDNANAGQRTATVNYLLANGNSGGTATDYALPSQTLPALVTPKVLTIAGTVASGKVYDGTTAGGQVTPGTLGGLVGNETLTLAGVGTYDSRNAGQRSVDVHYNLGDGGSGGLAANYLLPDSTGLAATISQRPLQLVFQVATRAYDATTAAAATVADDRVAGDLLQYSFSASYADSAAAQGKPVAISQLTVTGTDAGNYSPVLTPASGTVTPRAVGYTLTLADPGKVWTVGSTAQIASATLDQLVASTFVNAVGNESAGTLAYSLWRNGVRVPDASLPGVYEVRAVFTPADTSYVAAAAPARWPTLVVGEGGAQQAADTAKQGAATLPTTALTTLAMASGALTPAPSNVVAASALLAAGFEAGANLSLVGAPSGNESSQAMGMSQAAQLLGIDARVPGTDVRVPIGRNSLVTLVNGGVRLPDQVDQMLFVVADGRSNAAARAEGQSSGSDKETKGAATAGGSAAPGGPAKAVQP